MAADRKDDFRSRRQEREREELKSTQTPPSTSKNGKPMPAENRGFSDLDGLLAQVSPLLEHLDRLYNMYLAGAEKSPPVVRRKILDQLLVQMSQHARLTSAHQFRYQSMLASVRSHMERWDRLLKEFEKGQIKRRS